MTHDDLSTLLQFLDKHPNIFLAILLIVGVVIVVFGIPLPKRVTKMNPTTGETTVTWSLTGGIPGLGRGLVELGRGVVMATQTIATEQEKNRQAHAAELSQLKAALDGVRSEQAETNTRVNQTIEAIAALTVQVRDVAQGLLTVVSRHVSDVPPPLSSAPQTIETMRTQMASAPNM